MKKIIIIALFLFAGIKKVSSQLNDSTLSVLITINQAQYIGKSLDSIIAVLAPGYIQMKIYGIRSTARKLTVKYPNKVWIDLQVRQFNFMNPVDPNRIWD